MPYEDDSAPSRLSINHSHVESCNDDENNAPILNGYLDGADQDMDAFTDHWFNSTSLGSSTINEEERQNSQAKIHAISDNVHESLIEHSWVSDNDVQLNGTESHRSTSTFHPLRSPSVSSKSSNPYISAVASTSTTTDGVTRPRLTRLLSESALSDSNSTTQEPTIRNNPRHPSQHLRSSTSSPHNEVSYASALPDMEHETAVIVHRVAPNDSLPGVALRYGVSLAALRRANHLWTADPIYLRTKLYIPVDNLRKNTNSNSRVDAIRHVPASSLSFFPPSTSSSIPPGTPPSSSGANTTPSPPINIPRISTLSSLIASIPARLSLDSGSSTTSEEAHELDEVGSGSASHSSSRKEGLRGKMPVSGISKLTPPHEINLSPTSAEGYSIPLREISTSPRTPVKHDRVSSSYDFDENEEESRIVRTAQLEPSPEMKLFIRRVPTQERGTTE